MVITGPQADIYPGMSVLLYIQGGGTSTKEGENFKVHMNDVLMEILSLKHLDGVWAELMCQAGLCY